jgi:hypothetical protein
MALFVMINRFTRQSSNNFEKLSTEGVVLLKRLAPLKQNVCVGFNFSSKN